MRIDKALRNHNQNGSRYVDDLKELFSSGTRPRKLQFKCVPGSPGYDKKEEENETRQLTGKPF